MRLVKTGLSEMEFSTKSWKIEFHPESNKRKPAGGQETGTFWKKSREVFLYNFHAGCAELKKNKKQKLSQEKGGKKDKNSRPHRLHYSCN